MKKLVFLGIWTLVCAVCFGWVVGAYSYIITKIPFKFYRFVIGGFAAVGIAGVLSHANSLVLSSLYFILITFIYSIIYPVCKKSYEI